MQVLLLSSVSRCVPVMDGDKIATATKRFRGRDQKINVHDHAVHKAGEVVDIDDDEANELMRLGRARLHDPIIDEAIDPLA